MSSQDIKTPEQIKIALASIRLHGHILAWAWGYIAGFALGFWFGISPRPETQLGLLQLVIARLLHWLGALSWFPAMQAFNQANASVSLFSYFYIPLSAGFIAAAAALLARFSILSKMRGKVFKPSRDKTIRGAGKQAQSTADQLKQMQD